MSHNEREEGVEGYIITSAILTPLFSSHFFSLPLLFWHKWIHMPDRVQCSINGVIIKSCLPGGGVALSLFQRYGLQCNPSGKRQTPARLRTMRAKFGEQSSVGENEALS